MTEKPASQILDQISNYAKEHPGIVNSALAAAGAGGLAGGYLSSKTKKRPGESRGSRRMRILRDALLMAGGAGAAVGLGGIAHDNFANALPKNDTDPVTNVFTSPFGRSLFAAGAGGATAWAGNRWSREPKALDLLLETQKRIGEPLDKSTARVVKSIDDVRRGDARALLDRVLKGKFKEFVPGDAPDLAKINRLGLTPHHAYRAPGITGFLGNKAHKALVGWGDKIMESDAGKVLLGNPVVKPVTRALGGLSKSIYRRPGVAAAVAAGAMTPEIVSGIGDVPGVPNPFHRE